MKQAKTPEKQNSVPQLLYGTARPALLLMRLAGYLPHPITKHYEVTNNFCSIPFFWSLIVLIILPIGAVQLYDRQDTFLKRGETLTTPTDKFCRLMIVWTLMLSTFGFAVKAFLCRKATKEFWSLNYSKMQELGRIDTQFDLESERFQGLKRMIARSNFIWAAVTASINFIMVGIGAAGTAIVISTMMHVSSSLTVSNQSHKTLETHSLQSDTQSGSLPPIATITAFAVAHLYITIPVYMAFFLQVYGACLETIVSDLCELRRQFSDDCPCLIKVDSLPRCPPDAFTKKVKGCIRAYYIIKDLVDAFSRHFAFEITIVVVASLMTILTSAFIAFYHGFDGIHNGWISLLVPLIRIGVNVAHLYIMTSTCTSLTKQADQFREQLVRVDLDLVSISMQAKVIKCVDATGSKFYEYVYSHVLLM